MRSVLQEPALWKPVVKKPAAHVLRQINQSVAGRNFFKQGTALFAVLYDEVITHLGNDFWVFCLAKTDCFFGLLVWLNMQILAGLLQFINQLLAEYIKALLIEEHELEHFFEKDLVDIFSDEDQVLREGLVAGFCRLVSQIGILSIFAILMIVVYRYWGALELLECVVGNSTGRILLFLWSDRLRYELLEFKDRGIRV